VPLLNSNLEGNRRPAKKGFFLSDMIYQDERMQYDDQINRPYSHGSESIELDNGNNTQAKEFIEFNLQFQYTSDDESPLKVVMDIPVDEKAVQ
jgi:hypothetical protein